MEQKNYQGSLQQEPAQFVFEERNLNFELGFTGDPYRNGHYTLKVEGYLIEYFPEMPKVERPSFDIGRSEIKANMTGKSRQMKFPFIVKGKFMYLVVLHNKQTKFTKVQIGKNCVTVKGKKLN